MSQRFFGGRTSLIEIGSAYGYEEAVKAVRGCKTPI